MVRENFEFKYLKTKRELEHWMKQKEEIQSEKDQIRRFAEVKNEKREVEQELEKMKREKDLLQSLDSKQSRNLEILREERDVKQRRAIMLESVGFCVFYCVLCLFFVCYYTHFLEVL